jgi:hypothetical protein
MNENKVRPIRIYGEGGNLYVYGGRKKKKIVTKLKKSDAQKQFMNKITGTLKMPPAPIVAAERPVYRPRFTDALGAKTKPLEHTSKIMSVRDTDEGLKQEKRKRSDDEKIEEVRKKLLDGKTLTDEEKLLIPIVGDRDRQLEVAQAKRDEDIKELFREEGLNVVDFPFRAWNGLRNGNTKVIYKDLKWFIDQMKRSHPGSLEFAINEEKIGIHPPDPPILTRGDEVSLRTKSLATIEKEAGGRDAIARIRRYVNYLIEKMLSQVTPEIYNTFVRKYPIGGPRGGLFNSNRQIDNPQQLGTGKLPALWDDQIEEYFADEKKYPHFGGVIAADQIKELPKKLPIGFVMNLDKSGDPGSHWVAVYINGDSVEYFDPLADPPSKEFVRDIKAYLESMHVPVLFKFKVNKIKWQSDTSDHCGWFCIQWLDNRFHGIPFADSTHFVNQAKKGEGVLQKEFDYI